MVARLKPGGGLAMTGKGGRAVASTAVVRHVGFDITRVGPRLAARFTSWNNARNIDLPRSTSRYWRIEHMKRVVTTASGLALAFAVSVAAQSGSTSGTQGTSGTAGTSGTTGTSGSS